MKVVRYSLAKLWSRPDMTDLAVHALNKGGRVGRSSCRQEKNGRK